MEEGTGGLDAVVAQLHREFGGAADELVERVLAESYDELAKVATVTSFLPLLAHREARRRLAVLVTRTA